MMDLAFQFAAALALWKTQLIVASHSGQLSLVLPLTLEDAGRAMLLLGSLDKCWQDKQEIETLWVVVPEHQVFAFAATFENNPWHGIHIEVISERSLFQHHWSPKWQGYALQMSLKLLVSKMVKTDFYLTLDADVICAAPLKMSDIIQHGKGGYVPELRTIHPQWWEASETLLGLDQSGDHVRFGATPAVLRTKTALSVLKMLENKLGEDWEMMWLENWGMGHKPLWWTEYTLYRIVAEQDENFEEFHTPIPLYCDTSVWFEDDAKTWTPAFAFMGSKANDVTIRSGGEMQSWNSGELGAPCPFFVLQSRLNIPVSHIATLIAPWVQAMGST